MSDYDVMSDYDKFTNLVEQTTNCYFQHCKLGAYCIGTNFNWAYASKWAQLPNNNLFTTLIVANVINLLFSSRSFFTCLTRKKKEKMGNKIVERKQCWSVLLNLKWMDYKTNIPNYCFQQLYNATNHILGMLQLKWSVSSYQMIQTGRDNCIYVARGKIEPHHWVL